MSITLKVLHLQLYVQLINIVRKEFLPCYIDEGLKLFIFVYFGESFLPDLTNYILYEDVELLNLLVFTISKKLIFFVPLFTLRYYLNQEFQVKFFVFRIMVFLDNELKHLIGVWDICCQLVAFLLVCVFCEDVHSKTERMKIFLFLILNDLDVVFVF